MMQDVIELDDVEMIEKWRHRWYQYSRTLKQYRLDKLPKRTWVTNIYVFHGETGMGKSRRAWYLAERHGGKVGIIITPQSERDKFWGDGCVGADVIIMDDMASGQIGMQLFLRLLDRYPMIVEVKGTSMQWAPHEIYITSNTHPRDWYPQVKWRGSPLQRRLNEFGMITKHTMKWEPPSIEPEALEIIPDTQLPDLFQEVNTMFDSHATRTIESPRKKARVSEMPIGLSDMPTMAALLPD